MLSEQTSVEWGEIVPEPTFIQPWRKNVEIPSSIATVQINLAQAQVEPPPEHATSTPSSVGREHMHNFSLTPEHLSTPEVQRVVVEHIVKSSDILKPTYLLNWDLFQEKSPVQIMKLTTKPGELVSIFTWLTPLFLILN